MHRGDVLRSLLLPAALLVAGCGSSDDAEKELRSIASRAATAHLVTGEWERGAAATPYASSTLRVIAGNLEKDSSSLASLPLPARHRGILGAHLSELSLAVREAGAAVSQGNRPAARNAMQRMDAVARAFIPPVATP
ncbi:MAG: hypothetical protein ACR2OG_11285 [Gemmatimonadaceae bacterium]